MTTKAINKTANKAENKVTNNLAKIENAATVEVELKNGNTTNENTNNTNNINNINNTSNTENMKTNKKRGAKGLNVQQLTIRAEALKRALKTVETMEVDGIMAEEQLVVVRKIILREIEKCAVKMEDAPSPYGPYVNPEQYATKKLPVEAVEAKRKVTAK